MSKQKSPRFTDRKIDYAEGARDKHGVITIPAFDHKMPAPDFYPVYILLRSHMACNPGIIVGFHSHASNMWLQPIMVTYKKEGNKNNALVMTATVSPVGSRPRVSMKLPCIDR